MRFSILLSVLLLSAVAFAQSGDEELAAYYYGNGEYEKAEVLYKSLFKKQPNSNYIYENYLNCLIALDKYKNASSLVKKQIKREPESSHFKVDLGYVYMSFDKKDKATAHFNALVDDYTKDRPYAIHQLAQAFLRRDYYDWAILTFEKGIAQHGLSHYWSSLLNLYRATGHFEKATDLGLEVVQKQPRRLGNVIHLFGYLLEQDGAAEYIQKKTLIYVQRYPNMPEFDELLMNVYLQQKKFKQAYRQAKATDMRLKADGAKVLDIAKLCVSNRAYDVAELAYQYLIDKGPNSLYYIDGRVGLLNSQYLEITSKRGVTDSALNVLTDNYETFLADFSYSPGTSQSMKRLAELYLLYTDQPKKAISLLTELLELRRLSSRFRGEAKLLLGDAYLASGDIWEARLLYGQVDKENKEDELGQEAKFRSARLSYFSGDFEWANEQLEILKTATSQLIANNALELALLIQENTGEDSTGAAMKEYAHAEFLLYQNKFEECLNVLDALPILYPGHSLEDEVLYLKGRLMEKQAKYSEALTYYEKVYTAHRYDILADNALFAAAEIQYHIFEDLQQAKLLYEELIIEFTSSLFTVEARKKFNTIEKNPLPLKKS